MNPRLVFCFLSLLIAGSGYAADQAKKVSANAGTGPYNIGPQTGLTPISELRLPLNNFTRALSSSDPGKVLGALIVLESEVARRVALKNLGLEILQAITYFLNIEFSQFVFGLFDIDDLLLQIVEDLTDQVDADERSNSLSSFNSGFFFHQSSAYEFNNLILSTGEHGPIHNSSAIYFTAGSFVPVTGPGAGITGRLGAGLAFGDAYRTVGSVSGASYLSPGALDVAGTISTLIKAGKPLPIELTSLLLLIPEKSRTIEPKTRTLLDHIRPGDAWLTLGLRQISESTDDRVLANGTMGEAELTFALDDVYPGTYSATTFSLSGIYSANKRLGVDELGFGLRTPLPLGTRRSFVSARYGTRGHYTIAIEVKL